MATSVLLLEAFSIFSSLILKTGKAEEFTFAVHNFNDTRYKYNLLLDSSCKIIKDDPDCLKRTLLECTILQYPHLFFSFSEQGFDVNRRANGGNTALMTAVLLGAEEAVSRLCELGAIAHLENNNRSTPFLAAVLNLNENIIKVLVKNGADLYARFSDGSTYLHRAVEEGSLRAVIRLLDLGTTLDSRNDNDETPLAIAVQQDKVAIANVLLSRGSDIWGKIRGSTYLHLAVENGSLKCLRNLLEIGLPADAKNDVGLTPIFTAVEKDDLASTFLLATYGAALNQTYQNNGTYLVDWAVHKGSKKCIPWLIGHSIPISSGFKKIPWADVRAMIATARILPAATKDPKVIALPKEIESAIHNFALKV